MPDLSPRENYLRALRHEETEYVPFMSFFDPAGDVALCGLLAPLDRGNASTNFLDGFGVRWTASDSVAGGMIPAPGEFLLKDVTQWKKTVPIPDVGKIDWAKLVEQEAGMFPRDPSRAAVFLCSNGIWERIAALMGFEEAMIAMMEEPDACNELFTAVTDYKIKLAGKIAEHYKADVFINFDDIATERQLFMSPATYRALIKPHHKRLNDAVRNLGMIPVQHTCGHAELCIEDYIETGAECWNAVQPSNDIAAILDSYGGRFCIEGGYDTTGKPGRPDATPADVAAEVERCFREYGGKKGYIFAAALIAPVGSQNAAGQTAALNETVNRIRFAGK